MIRSKKVNNSIDSFIRDAARFVGVKKVVATISGGPDSVALLAALKSQKFISVTAAHCNFHLRGEESDRDEKFVTSLCSTLGVELRVKHFDVPLYIKENKGKSVEMACRELRYEWFRTLLREEGADRIATGHNADDNIETFFLNLLRGSGSAGLKAMVPDNGEIWRPLLSVSRKEILGYLDMKGLLYVTDSTNLKSDYRRNFLRNEIIPMLRSKWEGFDKAMGKSISHILDENRIVEKAIAEALPEPGSPLLSATVFAFPAPELLVRRYISPLKPFSTTASEVLQAIKADKPDIRRWSLPGGMLILRNHRLSLKPDPASK